MDRVGFEPTTSAMSTVEDRIKACSNPTRSTLFLFACSLVLYCPKRSFEKNPAKAVKQSLGMSNIILSSKTSFYLAYSRYYEMVSILFLPPLQAQS
jgi:hypothetical protein